MKKTLHRSLIPLVSILLIINSCTGPSSEVYQLIPETAMAVVTVHPGNLLEKGKLQELSFVQQQADQTEFTKKIFEDPEASGIDFDNYSSFFLFGDDPQYGSIVMPLENKEDFEAMIEELQVEVDEKFEKDKLEGYDMYIQNNGLILYDNSLALVLFSMGSWGNDLKEVAEGLVNMKQEEKILSDKDFKSFLGKQEDINAWFTTSNLKGLDQLGDAVDFFGGVKNNYGHVFLNFEKGAMVLSTNLRFNQTMQETVDNYNFLDQDAIKALLDYIPSEDMVFVGNTNVNPEKIIDLLNLVNKEFDETIENLAEMMEIDEEDLEKAFSGEMAFSVNGVSNMKIENEYSSFEENMPVVVAATRMTNERLFNKFLKAAEDKTVIIEKEGYYKVNNQGLPAYMVLNDADLVVSNKEDIIREISEKGSLSENVTQADYSDILTKNPICFYLNLDSRTYSNEMQKFIEDEMDGSIEMGLKTFGDKLKSLSFSASLEEWELRMELTEEDEYSLYTLLSQVDK